ncbi:hypothetical protein N6H05_14920 [Sphingobium sp. WTD-1]|uniref:hypothetical protein n=1 Tax=Sphingobium sp. WTD-1 TaxID=2979467 RepID=UPI0024DE5FC5|nr:hypothetical protein [Sphingobium sp. WTD-1]WIA54357.1 hypothetical protein N6H05_14920 [Sphingobium sp. WTD-1]
MTDRDTLLALAERVEGLPAEWCVDYRSAGKEIHRSIFGAPEVAEHSGYGWREDDSGWWMLTGEDGRIPPQRIDPAKWLTSIDTAMTLLPEKWKLRGMQFSAPCADDRKWHLNLHGGREGQDRFVGRGATPALAMTAAALRARAGGL